MKSDKLTVDALASYFDHTCLKAYATNDDLIKLCNEAKEIKEKLEAAGATVEVK
jgi:deoxyribose-phosphate aldolase